ncbi:GL16461 [Drosophila persimilis]|uniref:GL16461 n=1 Tax=Drosophila persimilis TaxID=7234 RepID=B4GQQ8_DROPE|nr:GL16461 [Drosophila persimilis]
MVRAQRFYSRNRDDPDDKKASAVTKLLSDLPATVTVLDVWPHVPLLAMRKNPLFPRFMKVVEVSANAGIDIQNSSGHHYSIVMDLLRRKVSLNQPYVGVFLKKVDGEEEVVQSPDECLVQPRHEPLPEHKKTKPPKFVPFEPYPGAVNPMTAAPSTKHKIHREKNNLDIGVLVDQGSILRIQELDPEPKESDNKDASNGEELKNLLVASVGEDLQTRVNLLTEDKLQLARALMDTANNLTTHTEQIKFHAGQCEVWRSKFLTSSVMVEELARWKADLTQKSQILNQSTKHQIQLDMLKQLMFLTATDVITLSVENLNILQLHTGVGIPEETLKPNDCPPPNAVFPTVYASF